MTTKKNKLRALLAKDEVQVGIFLGLNSAVSAEVASLAGFDWCLIDAEHGPFDYQSVASQVVAMDPHIPVALRIPAGQDWMIKQMLDLGVQTIMVPMVNTADEAKQLAHSMRYPPVGGRGLASAIVRASRFGTDADYPEKANDEVFLFVQAESRQAIENIAEIAGTPGVDGVFIGPSDLSADMGYVGNPQAPEVVELIEVGLKKIVAAGKVAGIFASDASNVAGYGASGVRFLSVGSDVAIYNEALQARAREAKANK